MRRSIRARSAFVAFLLLCISATLSPAWAKSGDTAASRVFAAVSPSIVVVEAFDKHGHAIAQGSGVVIAKGVVVSNCHVFEEAGTQSASVFYRKKRLAATLHYDDPEHDLCAFTVKGLSAPPVRMRRASTLKVGENAYAVGAPEGFDLTLSNGLVSGLRKIPGGTVIQTTAPISPGSSGGGLFDSQGHLIGITAYYMKGGEQLNFALPVEWIKALPQRGKTPKELASQPPNTRADFQKGVRAELSGDYATALSIFKPLAEHGDADAQYNLGWMYDNGHGVPQDHAKALYWYRKAAEQGDASGQVSLGVMYDNGHGVPQDYAKAVYWYRKAAAQGDAKAQTNLGVMYDNGQGVPQDSAKALYWFRKAAAQGVAKAQFNLGVMYDNGHGVPQDHAKALYWYRKAAAQGDANAQFNLGVMYYNGHGVPQDYAKAAKWLILAQAAGKKKAGKVLNEIEHEMTPTQIAEAQRLAREWWAKHHKQ